MSADIVKYAFTAGEFSPKLYGRTDLEKYDLGVALARNFIVDYRGGLISRPGQKFCDYVQHDDKPVKMFKFQFAPGVDKTYLLVFGHQYIRFMQAGAYILETGVAVTSISKANPGVVTSAGHGYANGDLVKPFGLTGMVSLNSATFYVAGATTNTFTLLDYAGNPVNTTALPTQGASGNFFRAYTVATTYDAADLALLQVKQSKSQVIITHQLYKPTSLVRVSDTNWTLNDVVSQPALGTPTIQNITSFPAANGNTDTPLGAAYAVTAVDQNGDESLISPYGYLYHGFDITAISGNWSVQWGQILGAQYYNIYRSIYIPGNAGNTGAWGSASNVDPILSRALELGFLGKSFGTVFTDSNIIPDFTKTPPNYVNPFANGEIYFIEVTGGGSGYDNNSTLSVTGGGGTGFLGFPVVVSGAVVAIVIINPGHDYTSNPSIVALGGSGATFNSYITPVQGAYPMSSCVFQQRQIFAASSNSPLEVIGSRTGQFSNFDYSSVLKDDDALSFIVDSRESAPLQHLIPTRFGLVMFSATGFWHLGSDAGIAITPTSAVADLQSTMGASSLPPLLIDADIVYQLSKGQSCRLITYTAYTRVYTGQDLSIIAEHLFPAGTSLVTWDYAAEPFKLIPTVRSDGRLLYMALNKEQNVYAWSQGSTRGRYKDVCVLTENSTDTIYYIVERFIQGRLTQMIEQAQPRNVAYVEDYWGVDCGLSLPSFSPAANLTPAASSGIGVAFTADANVFSAGNVGSVIRGGGGKAIITTYVSATQVLADFTRHIRVVLSEDPSKTPYPIPSGSWTMDAPVTSVGNLGHLEGQLVSILADGSVNTPQVVTNGRVPLDQPATRVQVGMGFDCLMRSLPPDVNGAVIAGKRQRTTGLAVRFAETKGLLFGEKLSNMYPLKIRATSVMGESGEPRSDLTSFNFPGSWKDNYTQYYLQQSDPLPASIVGLVTTLEVGDDSRANGQN